MSDRRWTYARRTGEARRLDELHQAFVASPCPSRKIAFKKRRDAQSEATQLNKRLPPNGPNIHAHVYRCGHCHAWHVGRPKFKLREAAE